MRIVLDLQGMQGASRNRGIGRYTSALATAIVRNRGEHEILLALNGALRDTIAPIKEIFLPLLPEGNIKIWYPPEGVSFEGIANDWRRRSAEIVREYFLTQLNADIVYLMGGVFEGFDDDTVTSVALFSNHTPVAVTLYDLIPLIYPEVYFKNPRLEHWYYEKLDHLRRSDLLLSISQSSKEEGLSLLSFPKDQVVNINGAVDSSFKKCQISAEEERLFREKYGLETPFVFYLCGIDHRKNVEGLIRAYGKIDYALRREHRLVIICNANDHFLSLFKTLAAKQKLHEEEIIFINSVDDRDLISFYNLCKLFVFPSWHEGFGLPALEAMACGACVIGANTSSLPEVIGKEEALFDPFSDDSIAAKMSQVLSDENFRQELIAHGKKQAELFSWDICAQKALWALEAQVQTSRPKIVRKKMAIVLSKLPKEDDLVLICELSRFYDLELIPLKKLHLTGLFYPIKSVDYLQRHSLYIDRIVYFSHGDIDDLIETIPGVILWAKERHEDAHEEALSASTVKELYDNYGYHCVYDCFHYGKKNVGMLEKKKKMALHLCYPHDSSSVRELADQYYKDIELAYEKEHLGQKALMRSLADIKSIFPIPEQDLLTLAQSIGQTLEGETRERILFVDISELVQRDAKSGVQRVVRSILRELLEHPPVGYRVEPVYAVALSPEYRYARNYTFKFLGLDLETELSDSPIIASQGDFFLGLDLQHHQIMGHEAYLKDLAKQGVKIQFVVYDLLPVTFPHFFTPGTETLHAGWLKIISQFDGAICISKDVANLLENYFSQNMPEVLERFKIDFFHLGSDIHNSVPSLGIPEGGEALLKRLQESTTFLMVSTLEPRKGYEQTFLAFDELWSRGYDINLVIVGKQGWLMDSLIEKMLYHPQYNKRLIWAKEASDEFLQRLYASSHCLISASFGEGFGLPLIEASEYGLPIIARDIPVFREVAGEHAFYFKNSAESHELAEAIVQWLTLYKMEQHPSSAAMRKLTWAESAHWLMDSVLRLEEGTGVNKSTSFK